MRCHIMQAIYKQNNLYSSKYSDISLIEQNGKSVVVKHTKKVLTRNVTDVLLSINSSSKSICKIFDIETIQGEYSTRIFMEHIDGRHIYGRLSSRQDEELIATVEMASLELKEVVYKDVAFPNVLSKTSDFIHIAGNQRIKNLGTVLWQKYLDFGFDKEHEMLCLYDLHRGNILCDENEKWHLIDLDAIISASNTFMFSCLMAVGFLLEGYSPKWIKRQIMRHYDKEKKQIYFEIMIRLFWGYAFFSQEGENAEMLKKYYRCIQEFNKECLKLPDSIVI